MAEPSTDLMGPLQASLGMVCWFAQFTDVPCDGALVRCHLLTQQRLRTEYPEGAVWLEGRMQALSWFSYERDGLAHLPTAGPVIARMSLRELKDDRRTWVHGCGGAMGNGGHHAEFDGYKLKVPYSAIPPETIAFVDELRLLAMFERDRRFEHTEAS